MSSAPWNDDGDSILDTRTISELKEDLKATQKELKIYQKHAWELRARVEEQNETIRNQKLGLESSYKDVAFSSGLNNNIHKMRRSEEHTF